MLEIKNLTKTYADFTALKEISLSIKAGKIIGLLGPNGAGKTTLMRIIAGYHSATSGTCSINGIEIHTNPLQAKQLIGYLPEHPPLYGEMSVKEYLTFAAQIKNTDSANAKKEAARTIHAVGLDDRSNQIIETLSKGYKQRVGLAMTLINNPKLLILDEPTSGLDPNQIIEMRKLISGLAEKRTVIISSHILQEISSTCDHIIIIHNGSIIADNDKKSLVSSMKSNSQVQVRIGGSSNKALPLLREKFDSVIAAGEVIHISDRNMDEKKPLIAETLVKNSIPLLELSGHSMSLEELFHKLTLGK